MALLAVATAATGVAWAFGSSTAPADVSGCPQQTPGHLTSSRGGATATLVPTGATRVVLCRYDGPFGASRSPAAPRFRLVAALTLTGGRARTLASELDHLPKLPAGCVDRSGSAVVGFFGYQTGSNDPVRIGLGGCGAVTNGHVVRGANLNGDPFLDKLEAVIHARPANPRNLGSANATIAGYLRLCGGPAPGRCFRSTIGSCGPPLGCSRTDRVVAIGTSGLIVAQQRLRFPWPNGRFRLLVPAGRYAIELLADGPRVHDSLVQTVGVTARAGHRAKVIFTFSVP